MPVISRAATVALLLAVMALATTSTLAAAPQTSQPFYFMDPDHATGDPVPGAHAHLVRTPQGISAQIGTGDLDPGTYTTWWVVWNDPGECVGGCGEDDLGAPGNFVGFATGNVVGESGMGGFGAHLQAGQEGVPGVTVIVSNEGHGLTNPGGAEVHMIVRHHGPLIPAEMPGQISTFAGACTPASSFLIGTGSFDCVDLQAVVFLP